MFFIKKKWSEDIKEECKKTKYAVKMAKKSQNKRSIEEWMKDCNGKVQVKQGNV